MDGHKTVLTIHFPELKSQLKRVKLKQMQAIVKIGHNVQDLGERMVENIHSHKKKKKIQV